MDLKELARDLGLSPTTISRVLNGQASRYRIAKATQSRVLEAARTRGVTVNLAARSLRLGVSHVLGLIVPDISNPFFAALARQVEHAARLRGYSVLLADSQEAEAIETESFTTMQSRGVDGLIVAPVSGNAARRRFFAKWTKPKVVIDRASPQLDSDSVVLDNFGAARRGVELLAKGGHRAIACLHGGSASYADRERLRGYREAIASLGLRGRPGWIAGGAYSIQSGRQGLRDLLAGREKPTAVLALGNLLALGALSALQEAGLSVPAQISIISFDEQPWAASLAPPMTTIAQPVQEMGEKAVELLLESLAQGGRLRKFRRIVLPFSVIERASIRTLPNAR